MVVLVGDNNSRPEDTAIVSDGILAGDVSAVREYCLRYAVEPVIGKMSLKSVR